MSVDDKDTDLRQRVQELEEENEQRKEENARLKEQLRKMMPTRRDVLAAGGAGLATYLATGGASAADDSAGQLGSAQYPQDITLDEIKDPGGDPVADLDDTGLWSFQRGLDLPSLDTDSQTIADTATDPSTNGEVRRNGADVRVYSGGAVRNLTNVGSGGGGGAESTVIATPSDTASDIQTKLNNLGTGEELLLDGGEFVFNSQVSIPAGAQMRGLGPYTTTIKSAIDSSTIPIVVGSSDNVVLRDFAIDGNKANSGSSHTLDLGSTTQSVFRNLRIFDAGMHAIIGGQVTYSYLGNITIKTPANRGLFYYTGNPGYNRHHNLYMRSIPDEGIQIQGNQSTIGDGKNMTFNQCDIRDAGTAVKATTVRRIFFNLLSAVHGTGDAVVIEDSDYIKLGDGSEIWANGGHGVRVDGGTACKISGDFGSNDGNNNGNNDVLFQQSSSGRNSVGNKVIDAHFDKNNGNVSTSVKEADSSQDNNLYDDLQFTGGYSTTVSIAGSNSQEGLTNSY